jgi:hypothetical protein
MNVTNLAIVLELKLMFQTNIQAEINPTEESVACRQEAKPMDVLTGISN